jgi:hypothetical protein
MVLWLLAFPLSTDAEKSSRSRLLWRLAYVIAGSVAIAAYFISYRHPPLSPPAASPGSNAPGLLRFFLIWIGSLFRVANPVLAGGLVVSLFLALATIAGSLMIKRRQWQPHYPWLVLVAYTLISGAITAVARLGFGFEIAKDNHYTVFTVMLYIAVIGLAFTIFEQLRDNGLVRRGGVILGVASAALFLALGVSTFNAEWRFLKKSAAYRKHLLLIFRWADALPLNPELKWMTPYPDTSQVIHLLAEHDVLRPRPVSKTLAQAVSALPGAGNPKTGVLEEATPDGNGRIVVKGRAWLPEQNRPADCVVVGWQTATGWQPRWVVETGETAGFSRPLLASVPEGGATLRAWAIDLEHDQAYALTGAITVAP